MSLLDVVHRRIIIVTGKGGVGKTTVTAALGRAFAAAGKRTLCAEIVPLADTPSALMDALQCQKLTEEPLLISPNLSAVLLTPSAGHLRFLQDALPLKILADTAMKSAGLRKFLAAAPGFSDMGTMYRMLNLMRQTNSVGQRDFDVCIIDSPATGHALALAQIPEFLTRVIPGGPIARAAHDGLKVLTDPLMTGTVIVTLPETLPVTEAMELEKGMQKHRLPVSAIVVNRVPPDPFAPGEREALRAALSRQASPVLGARELKRIERADTALTLIREKRPLGTLTLSEVPGVGAAVSAQLADLMGAAS